MPARPEAPLVDPADGPGRVSSRLLSELWLALARHGIQPRELLGDLPIEIDERGLVKAPVHWDHFNLFLKRVERHVGGAEGLERCGEWIGRGRTPHAFRALIALATSPLSLYRAAAIWAAPRAMPGVALDVVATSPNHLAIDVRVPDPLGSCTPVLHVATGIFRTLPRLLGMSDAVVESRVEARRAHYAITVPSSRTGLARLRRFVRSLLVPGSILRQLETRQLELNARHAALVRAHEASIASEARMRALSDASVDMLCELDETGRLAFVSASVRELMGYSPAQVIGSHYRLWIPNAHHVLATARFEALRAAPIGTVIARQTIELHAAHGRRIVAEASFRSYRGVEGEWRAVGIFRDVTPQATRFEGLETSLIGLAARYAGHPLEHSLARLVALLEALGRGTVPARADRMHEATRRMTRIVEHALLGEVGNAERGQWIETGKLVDRLRDEPSDRADVRGLPLRIELARGPAEIFGPESLLETCVASLVDWARERVRLDPAWERHSGLLLSIESLSGVAGGESAVRIAVTIESADGAAGAPGPSGPEAAVRDGAIDAAASSQTTVEADLALALAGDAARLLGGELESARPAHEGLGRSVRLPQPAFTAESGAELAQGDAIGFAPIVEPC